MPARGYLDGVANIDVRTAGPADLDALLTSVTGLFREDAGQHDPYMDQGWPARDGAAHYGGALAEPTCLILLAWHGDRCVGHLVGKLTGPDSIRTARFAILESLRADPTVRGQGVGSALVAEFLRWAKENGAERASVTAYAANERAQRFYQRHGFAPQSVVLRASI